MTRRIALQLASINEATNVKAKTTCRLGSLPILYAPILFKHVNYSVSSLGASPVAQAIVVSLRRKERGVQELKASCGRFERIERDGCLSVRLARISEKLCVPHWRYSTNQPWKVQRRLNRIVPLGTRSVSTLRRTLYSIFLHGWENDRMQLFMVGKERHSAVEILPLGTNGVKLPPSTCITNIRPSLTYALK